MKTFLTLSFVFTFIISHAETLQTDYWQVKSDQLDSTVKANTCHITGKVITAYSESPIEDGLISNFDRSANTHTNGKGEFSLVISIKDTSIFFYHEEYTEIVCWDYDFKSGHHVVMNFFSSEKMPQGMMIQQEKPVVYLYSDNDLSVNLKYSNANNFSFTYPTYNQSGWDINIENNQISVNGQEYPYLFWEGFSSNMNFISTSDGVQADYINTDSTIAYLENSLRQIGLNSTETTDFITYWGPRIKEYPFAQIQFLIDEAYSNEIGEVLSSKKIDSEKRIFMIFEGNYSATASPFLTGQSFEPFTRKGFTLIEWGGSELLLDKGL